MRRLQIAYQVVGSGLVDLVRWPARRNIEAMWDIPEISRFHGATGFVLANHPARQARHRALRSLARGPEGNGRRPPERRHRRARRGWLVLDILLATADGTPVAMMAAASYPERFRGMALYAASARLLRDHDYLIGIVDEVVEFVLHVCASCWGNEDDPGLWFLAPSVAGDPRWRASMARIERRSTTPVHRGLDRASYGGRPREEHGGRPFGGVRRAASGTARSGGHAGSRLRHRLGDPSRGAHRRDRAARDDIAWHRRAHGAGHASSALAGGRRDSRHKNRPRSRSGVDTFLRGAGRTCTQGSWRTLAAVPPCAGVKGERSDARAPPNRPAWNDGSGAPGPSGGGRS